MKYVTSCPQCNSTDVSIDFSNAAVWAYGTPSQNICNKCGHSGTVFPEVPVDKLKEHSKHVKNIKKDTKVDIKSGYFAGRLEILIFCMVIGFILLIYGLSVNSLLFIFLGVIVLIGVVVFYFKFKKKR